MRLSNHGTVVVDCFEAKEALLRLLLKKAYCLIVIVIELHYECVLSSIDLCAL